MPTYHFVSSSAVLTMLNRGLNRKTYDRLVAKFRYSNDRVKPRERQLVFDGHVHWWLRKYVDEWLGTGRNREGTETPFQRSLLRTDTAKQAANAYLQKHPFRTILDDELNISIDLLPEPSKRATPGALLADLGTQSKERADFLLVAMLASDWKRQLYRCPHCERYKVGKNPRPRYKHGRFCRLHLQAWTAKRLNRAKRQRTKAVEP